MSLLPPGEENRSRGNRATYSHHGVLRGRAGAGGQSRGSLRLVEGEEVAR